MQGARAGRGASAAPDRVMVIRQSGAIGPFSGQKEGPFRRYFWVMFLMTPASSVSTMPPIAPPAMSPTQPSII